ncbi:MAG: hypothetical protein HYU39_02205 [Thaumarchaeota archaeon]|nr:hypothetical protein [Nitrososphaerota archaeon]
MLIAPAKYCSACGEKLDECTCYDQTITISIGISRELIRGITNLTALLPRIQISSNRALAADKSLTTDHAQ